ncbi:HdeD family acid-resistance protein [Roseospira marina]|nr:DUF308 domain-containing protein [Roseospira marina]MBB4314451.1 uncharacterized membrane protein HdeD (DUF308 family) [Roseospira marina]MBB5087611.1 uncharacterized membrane protein HdeD (DUF308 family) [Roseospira marina]
MGYYRTYTAEPAPSYRDAEARGAWGVDPGDLTRIGVVSMIAGAVALILPGFVTTTIEWLVGLALVLLGAFEAMHALPFNRDRGSVWHLTLGVVGLAAGVLFIASPLTGALTLTMIVGLLFTASGLLKTLFAFAIRRLDGWTWTLGSGLLTLGVGLMILFMLPVISPWFLGILVAIELLLNGAWMVLLGRRGAV